MTGVPSLFEYPFCAAFPPVQPGAPYRWITIPLRLAAPIRHRGLVAPAALAHPGEQATQHVPATVSGFQALVSMLTNNYGAEAQDQAAQDIDDFLELRRGQKDLNSYLVEVEYRYDHAKQSSGLVINDVGLSHLLFKYCGLDVTTKAHLKMQVNFDLRRYPAIKASMQTSAKSISIPIVSANQTYLQEQMLGK